MKINSIEPALYSAGEVQTLDLKDLTLHTLAEEHPTMTEPEFNRLKDSMQEIGQLEPIIIYKQKIVDGRHRFWAAESLGWTTILAIEIPPQTPLETVREIVFGSEVRRHQSATQKAIRAWWAVQEDGLTYREAERKFMTSRTMIAACKYIADHRGNDILKDLYNEIPVMIGVRHTSSLRTAHSLIKAEVQAAIDARFKKEHTISIDVAKEQAKPYIDALNQEPVQVIECVAKGAYRMMKEKE